MKEIVCESCGHSVKEFYHGELILPRGSIHPRDGGRYCKIHGGSHPAFYKCPEYSDEILSEVEEALKDKEKNDAIEYDNNKKWREEMDLLFGDVKKLLNTGLSFDEVVQLFDSKTRVVIRSLADMYLNFTVTKVYTK